MARHASEDPTSSGRDPRLIVVIGVGSLALVALVFFVLLPLLAGGSSDSGATSAASTGVIHGSGKPKGPAALPQPTASPSPVATVINAGDASRDPFAPLSFENTGTGTTGVSTSTTSTSTSTPSTAGSTAATTGTTGTTSPVPSAAPSGSTSGTSSVTTVRLLAVVGSTARLEISGTEHSVKAGDKLQGFTIDKVDIDGVFLEYQGSSAALAPGESQNF